MDKLKDFIDKQFLRTAIKRECVRCMYYPGWRSGILTFSREKLDLVRSIIYQETCDCGHIKFPRRQIIGICGRDIDFCFDNGSYIRLAIANQSSRGWRFNSMIYDKDIGRPARDAIGIHRLHPFRGENPIGWNPESYYTECKII